ncbi:MAG: response regulator transcription factor [Bacteroidetes bacterium]|nr:response regulator transcription factor [Bacteroidota bacterium]
MKNEALRILLADYDIDSLNLFESLLLDNGYQVLTATNGTDVKNKAIVFRPHIILIDMMNAEYSGAKVVLQLRSNPLFNDTIILIHTATYEDAIQHEALNMVVDGFLNRDISSELFLMQIKRYLRRIDTWTSYREILDFPGLSIDVEGYVVRKDNRVIDLAKREFELLIFLASEPRRVFSRKEISNQIWGDQKSNDDRILDVYISKLRDKIGKNFIQTMKGVGYSFVTS